MHKNHVLLIVNSIYQLFTAIHLKCSVLMNQKADILLSDNTPQLKEYLFRLNETGLFQRVIFAQTSTLDRKYMIGKEDEISEGYDKIGSLFKWILSQELGEYERIYFANYDTFTRMLACFFAESCCEFICFEDGFSTYVIDFLKEGRAAVNSHPKGSFIKEKVTKTLLYEPRLCLRKDRIPNESIPKVNRSDQHLKELLNYVFDYKKPEKEWKFIFLEQSFRAENLKNNDLNLIKECCQVAGQENFIVKPHPRNTEHLPLLLGLTRKFHCDSPWELLLMNEDLNHTSLITVCSNGALTGKIVFGIDLNTIMLYRLFDGRVLWKEDDILKKYLFLFEHQFASNHYYVPETIYELRNIIRFLGGCHEE